MTNRKIVKVFYVILVLDWAIAQQISKLKCDEISVQQTNPRSIRPHLMDIGYIQSANDLRWECSGTLISGDFVLIHPWCMFSLPRKADDLRVRKFKLADEQYSNSQLFSVKAFLSRELYTRYEIGLIQLNTSIPYYESGSIYQPACLWTETIYPTSYTYAIIDDVTQSGTGISGNIFAGNECNNMANDILPFPNLLYICSIASGLQLYYYRANAIEAKSQNKNYILGFYVRARDGMHFGLGINNFISWIESIVWPQSGGCGEQKIKLKPLITYGLPTYHGEYPWHVAVYDMESGRKNYLKYICSGTIINRRTVLTAGHCVKNDYGVRGANQLTVVAGTINLKRYSSDTQNYYVRSVILHEKYNRAYLENDIAILKISGTIEFSDYIQPICIGNSSIFSDMRMGTVAGWGLDENRNKSNVLLQISMPLHSNTDCRQSNRDFFSIHLNDFNFCAGFQNGSNVCSGDSGGAMVYKHKSRWYIRGIVSAGPGVPNSDRCDITQLVLFTNVPLFYNWIMYNLDDDN